MTDYRLVSEAVILRDHTEGLKYKDETHKKLVDIADAFYNANIGAEYLKDDYKKLYNEYGADYFSKVMKDASALDSQVTGFGDVQDLLNEYEALLND